MRRSNEQTRRGREREIRPHSVVRAGSVVRQPPRDLKEKPWTNDDLNVMQLDIVDRAVFKTAGKCENVLNNETVENLKDLCSAPPQLDKRDLVHKDDLTKWINGILAANKVCVTDMFQDFRDGHNLITLIEVLAHEKLVRIFCCCCSVQHSLPITSFIDFVSLIIHSPLLSLTTFPEP